MMPTNNGTNGTGNGNSSNMAPATVGNIDATEAPRGFELIQPIPTPATGTGTNQQTKQKTSPTAAAKIALETQTESHHPAIQSILLPSARVIQDLRHKAFAKKNIIKKMEEEDDFVPHSARLNYQVKFADVTLKSIEPQRKKALEDQAQAAVVAFQAAIKGIIINAAKEDLAAYHACILEKTVDLIHKVTDTFITAEGITGTTVDATAYNCIYHHQAHLFQHYKDNPSVCITKYCDTYDVDVDQVQVNLPDLEQHFDTNEQHLAAVEAHNQAMQDPKMRGNLKLNRILTCALVTPYTAYVNQSEENKRALELKKKIVALLEGPATEATAMEVDQELPTDRPTLSAMINHAITQATAPLKQQINELKKKSAPKPQPSKENPTPRGRTQPGASPKKKSGQQTQPQNSRPRSRSRGSSVGSRNSGSGKGKQKKQQQRPKGKSKRRSNRRRGSSNTRNNRS